MGGFRTLSLVMGIAGAMTNSQFVPFVSVAGLRAGAFSLAAGEFISMKVQREVFENQIKLEEGENAAFPERETLQLLDI
ncbi:MAG: VIT1/CCC1 transporter family protein [Pyrinomonadaceae bacterium]